MRARVAGTHEPERRQSEQQVTERAREYHRHALN